MPSLGYEAGFQDQFDQLKSQNDSLKSENTQLRSQLGLPGPNADLQAPAGARVRHSGPLTLSVGGAYADLDSPMSDPQWQTGGYIGREIRCEKNLFYVNVPVINLGDKKSDYDTCRNTTGYREGSYEIGQLAAGQYLCLKTTGNRYSALRITELSQARIVLDVVTYDPPGT